MKYGARNQIIAKVTRIKRGNIMGQVSLEILQDSNMTSVMTLDSLDDLGLKEGDKVKAVVKAINVLLVKDY